MGLYVILGDILRVEVAAELLCKVMACGGDCLGERLDDLGCEFGGDVAGDGEGKKLRDRRERVIIQRN